jgi:predicted enzyme related to lactoylglutathione lyase
MHEYVVLAVPEGTPFGLALVPNAKPDPRAGHTAGVTLYFACDDPEAIVARAEAAGGGKRFGPLRLFGYGQIYQVEDPDGTRFGLYKKREDRFPER